MLLECFDYRGPTVARAHVCRPRGIAKKTSPAADRFDEARRRCAQASPCATFSNIGPKAPRFLTFAGLICARSEAHANPRRRIFSCSVNYRCRLHYRQDDQTGASPSPLHSLRKIATMNQSRASYYAEVIFYPGVVAAIVLRRMIADASVPDWSWLLICLAGLSLWGFVEYLMHRFILHRLPVIRLLHAKHHSRPSAYVGTPLWVSFSGFTLVAFLPLWAIAGCDVASGITCGLIVGYVWYLLVHDAVHRWRLGYSWIRKARLRHLLHHRAGEPSGNFGVTTDFWDSVFFTKIGQQVSSRRSRPQGRAASWPRSNVDQ